ncbi:Copper transporter 6 [Acorus gramineus]|uniref:Copper transport protein n=1 Tax=Acorus gramineus TaxID=55184 RepID=A0AAV9AL51_ACOGR|nr:Copper transporter 6 [Acorus gramineus]
MATDMETGGPNGAAATAGQARPMKILRMTFFWRKEEHILFHGWPGEGLCAYVLALVAVFLASVAVEWLGWSSRIDLEWAVPWLARTVEHVVWVGLVYVVVLALVSFNVGVFVAALVGHAIGFLVFSSGRG